MQCIEYLWYRGYIGGGGYVICRVSWVDRVSRVKGISGLGFRGFRAFGLG